MKIQKINIKNILGIQDLEFDAGKLVEISGPNGSGKTSVLEAIKSVLKGGSDATLLRKGEEKGETVIVLDDGLTVTQTVTAASSVTTATDADGKKIAKPASTIKALTDMLSVNPVDFLRATKKERVNVLLESLPIEIDLARLGIDPTNPGHIDTSLHPLVLIESVRKHIYDDRTGLNRAVKEKRATIAQLAATLPEQPGEAPATPTGLLDQLSELDKAKDAELDRIAKKLDALRTENDAEIAELRKQIETKQAEYACKERLAAAQRERTLAKHADETAEIRQTLAAVEAAQKQAAKHEQTRDTLTKMDAEAEHLQEQADGQTAALDAIDSYKSELLASLPIPGLSVVDGEIYRDGVHFDRLNTSQQVQIAIEIARLRAGELKCVCVDGLELMDSNTFAEFKTQAVESGLQMFITRVSDDQFKITSIE